MSTTMKSLLMLAIAVVAVVTATPTHQVHRGTKIIGGVNASIEDFPHYLQLEAEGDFVCGASIYNAHTAITSAFCVFEYDAAVVVLKSGSDQRGNGTPHQAVNIIIHPEYVDPGMDFDVALVIVDEPFDAKNAIPLVSSPPPGGALLNFTGLGATSLGGAPSRTLQTITIEAIDNEECKEIYDDFIDITDNMVCAENSAYRFDFGGPLEYQGQLAGTFTDGTRWDPGVYADIAKFKSWIEGNAA